MKFIYLFTILFLSNASAGLSSDRENTALTISDNDENIDSLVEQVEENFIKNSDEFHANENWQVVQEGQAIPAGLHIRLNLETGLREAKLLDGDKKNILQNDSEKQVKMKHMQAALEDAINELKTKNSKDTEDLKYWKEGDKEGMKKLEGKSFTKEELKLALKKFKFSKDDTRHGDKEHVQDKDVINKFKSMAQLKSDFADMKMEMKTDLEIIRSIYDRYGQRGTSEAEKINLLNELEYLLHQIDNANNFVDFGGIDMLIKDLNSTNIKLKSALLLVLVAAAQSNTHVQVAYMEAGLLQKLLSIVANEKDLVSKQRALVCLSALLRGFPYAQLKLLEFGGLNILMEFIKNAEIYGEKMAVKTLTLIHDLIQEQISLSKDFSISEELKLLKMDQYKRVPILHKVLQLDLCASLPSFLSSQDHDTVEKATHLLQLLQTPCRDHFRLHREVIAAAKDTYVELGLLEGDGEEGYFESIARTLARTLDFLDESDVQGFDREDL